MSKQGKQDNHLDDPETLVFFRDSLGLSPHATEDQVTEGIYNELIREIDLLVAEEGIDQFSPGVRDRVIKRVKDKFLKKMH